jgi:hypothetical protein
MAVIQLYIYLNAYAAGPGQQCHDPDQCRTRRCGYRRESFALLNDDPEPHFIA